MSSDPGEDDPDILLDGDQDEDEPWAEPAELQNNLLRTSDPYRLCRRLSDKLRELRDRREAQDLIDEGEALIADLKRDPAERRAEKERAGREKAERRAARQVPHGAKSAARAIGRFLARCETAFEDLLPEDGERTSVEHRIKLALAAARLASAAASLGNAMSTNAKTRVLLARTRVSEEERAPEKEDSGGAL